MKPFPVLMMDREKDRKTLLEYILKERPNDINDFTNLQNRFVSGRKSGKIPTGATDISSTDRIGDINYDDAYLYLVTLDSMGDAVWARIALDISW